MGQCNSERSEILMGSQLFDVEVLTIIATAVTAIGAILTAGWQVVKKIGDAQHAPMLRVMGNLIVADCEAFQEPTHSQINALTFAFQSYKDAGGNGAVEAVYRRWAEEVANANKNSDR